MKKLFLFGLLFVLLVSIASAYTIFVFSHPVHGNILSDGFAVKNVPIRVTNLNTGTSGETITDENGFYQIDLGNIDKRYQYGNTIKITLPYCETIEMCSKIAVVGDTPNEGGTKVSWDIADVDMPLPDDAVIVKFICWDKSTVATESDCPEQVICWDKSIVHNEDECPSRGISGVWKYLIEAIALVLGAFGWHKGFMGLCKYYWRKGEEAEKDGDHYLAEKLKRRAVTMAKTAVANAIAKKYEKKL